MTALTGCQEPEVPVTVDNRLPVVAEAPPPAITGGSMLVLADGRVAIADGDRDRVHVVSISPTRFDADVLFEDGVEPGRIVEGSEGLIHVVLRRAGDIATIDSHSGEVLDRRHTCTDPRGIAFDETSTELFVACADGMLVTLPEHAEAGSITRQFIEPDLRDIVIDGDMLLISRLRSAEILEVPKTEPFVFARRNPPATSIALPTVAWRMIEVAPGEVAMLHQYSATTEVRLTEPEDGGDHGEEGDTPYGGGGFCDPPIVSPGITTWAGADSVTTTHMAGPTPAVDLARGPSGQYAIAVAGAPDGKGDVHFSNDDDFCFEGFDAISTPGQPVSVAYLPDGRLLVQSREPSALYVYSDTREHLQTFELSSESRFDTGHDLYHRATGASISCASCHPEATDDGHVWRFEDLGMRRTQSPEVGLEGSAPFHWDGDMTNFETLTNEVYTHRMGGAAQSEARSAAFERWLFSTERAPAGTEVDDSLSAEGEALFVEYGCESCHSGTRQTNNQTVVIRGKALQVPSLRRIAVRPPYMHDGRSADLRLAVLDMLEATREDGSYTGHEVDAVTAYLRTL